MVHISLSKNIEDRLEQSLALACVLYLYQLHRSHILDCDLGTQRVKDYQKVVRYIIDNIKRVILVLVDFQNDYYSVNYQIIYLVSIPRVAIWNVITKQVILISSNIQMSGNKNPYS